MTEIDLVDWTIQEAQQLKSERRQPSDLDGGPSLDRLLAVLKRDPVGATNSEAPVDQIASAPSMQMAVEEPTSGQAVAVPEPDIVSNLPDPTRAAPPASGWVDAEMSNLLKAIVEPDIYTARADRNRAIDLRWVLRDIRSNRLNWSPGNSHDLRMLTIMGLVEMRDDAPVLTNAGFSAIE